MTGKNQTSPAMPLHKKLSPNRYFTWNFLPFSFASGNNLLIFAQLKNSGALPRTPRTFCWTCLAAKPPRSALYGVGCAGGSASPSRCRRLPRYALFLRDWTGQNWAEAKAAVPRVRRRPVPERGATELGEAAPAAPAADTERAARRACRVARWRRRV